MKKPTEPPQRQIQRESVRRAQQSARYHTSEATRRVIGQGGADGLGVGRSGAGPYPRSADVSVPVPHTLRRFFVALIVLVALGLIGYVTVVNSGELLPLAFPPGSTTSDATVSAAAVATGDWARIGLVSGHHGNDSGAVCQDGLTEAQVNFDIATRVAQLLRSQGYQVDVLDEFDSRLKGYRAQLLLSIHADSCAYINDLATGYKVARVVDSAVPTEDDHLVACISSRYKAATGLRFDARTVTYDMTKYHAFYEIDPHTPAAIIETGFLNLDRDLLTHRTGQVAQGIYNGILCFVDNDTP